MTFGERLKEIRTENGLKTLEIAEKLNISPIEYAKYEQGKLQPTEATLMALMRLFKVSKDYLLGNIDIKLTSSEQEVLDGFKTLTPEQRATLDYLVGVQVARHSK
jgi:transcriptional regulator with XRE-family HTH domain